MELCAAYPPTEEIAADDDTRATIMTISLVASNDSLATEGTDEANNDYAKIEPLFVPVPSTRERQDEGVFSFMRQFEHFASFGFLRDASYASPETQETQAAMAELQSSVRDARKELESLQQSIKQAKAAELEALSELESHNKKLELAGLRHHVNDNEGPTQEGSSDPPVMDTDEPSERPNGSASPKGVEPKLSHAEAKNNESYVQNTAEKKTVVGRFFRRISTTQSLRSHGLNRTGIARKDFHDAQSASGNSLKTTPNTPSRDFGCSKPKQTSKKISKFQPVVPRKQAFPPPRTLNKTVPRGFARLNKKKGNGCVLLCLSPSKGSTQLKYNQFSESNVVQNESEASTNSCSESFSTGDDDHDNTTISSRASMFINNKNSHNNVNSFANHRVVSFGSRRMISICEESFVDSPPRPSPIAEEDHAANLAKERSQVGADDQLKSLSERCTSSSSSTASTSLNHTFSESADSHKSEATEESVEILSDDADAPFDEEDDRSVDSVKSEESLEILPDDHSCDTCAGEDRSHKSAATEESIEVFPENPHSDSFKQDDKRQNARAAEEVTQVLPDDPPQETPLANDKDLTLANSARQVEDIVSEEELDCGVEAIFENTTEAQIRVVVLQ